jgi:hypothetical protein
MLKENEVAFLKTTGEPVFILAFRTENQWGKDVPCVVVNRPITGQDGILHKEETFRVSELESLEEQQARFMSERQKVIDKFGPKAEQSSSQDAGFGSN